jgi:DNA-directed RNA polymerase subunit RPC12/RpoP
MECNYVLITRADIFNVSKACQTCIFNKILKNFLDIIELNGGQLIGNYVNTTTHVKIKCKNGHIFEKKPIDITSKNRWCPDCPIAQKRTSIQCMRDFLEKLQKFEGELLEEYVNMKTPILVKCKFGHEFMCSPSLFWREDIWCNKCSGKCPIQAEEKLLEIIEEKEAILHDKYINAFGKLKVTCKNGHTFITNAHNIKGGHWCSDCPTKRSINTKIKFNDIINKNNAEVINKYINAKTLMEIICNNGHTFYLSPSDIIRGRWCQECPSKRFLKAKEKFYKKVGEKNGKVLGIYINSFTYVEILCENGHICKIKPINLTCYDIWCQECPSKRSLKTKEKFLEIVHINEGTLTEEYKSYRERVGVLCKKQHFFMCSPNYLLVRGDWCPICNKSKGEEKLKKILEFLNLNYTREYKFTDENGKYINLLEYDFYLDDYDILFEWDGEQHFEFSTHFHKTEKKFKQQQYRDLVKNHQAKINQKRLIRFDYTLLNVPDEDISDMINDFIDSKNKIFYSTPELYEWCSTIKVPRKVFEQYNVTPKRYITIVDE